MAQDHGLCRKKKRSNGPVHGPPLQARVAAANGTVRSWQTAGPNKLLALTDDPGAHGHERGQAQSKLNGGKMMLGSGHGRQNGRQAKDSPQNKHCRRTQPADSPPGTGLKQTAHSWPASQQNTTAADDDG